NNHGVLKNSMNERSFINPRKTFQSSEILVNDENDPNYILFNYRNDKTFNNINNGRSPFEAYEQVDPDAENKRAKKFKKEIVEALNSWQLKSLVIGLRPICYFNHGRYMVGESFEIAVSSTKVKVFIDRVLEGPLRVVLKVGDLEIVKFIEK
ncbi:MAG: hypothetical protein ACRC37_07295, partial [Lentisphaeria bacterium]